MEELKSLLVVLFMIVFVGYIFIVPRWAKKKGYKKLYAITKTSPKTKEDWDIISTPSTRIQKGYIKSSVILIVLLVGISLMLQGVNLIFGTSNSIILGGSFTLFGFGLLLIFIMPAIHVLKKWSRFVNIEQFNSKTYRHTISYLTLLPGMLLFLWWELVEVVGFEYSFEAVIGLAVLLYLLAPFQMYKSAKSAQRKYKTK